MKKIIIILTFIAIFINSTYGADTKIATKNYKVVTKDSFSIVATLEYPKIKNKKEYATVVLLHSLGYNSEWWEQLPNDLLNNGYAVLMIDFRGHGRSVYNSKLARVSWKSMTNTAYKKYPDDITEVIEHIKSENKQIFFKDWAIVGSDIGAISGIIAANKLNLKPHTIVMISPVLNIHGLSAPISLAELNNVDVLSIVGSGDSSSVEAQEYLSKFAQNRFVTYTSDSKSSGMLILKNDKSISNFITSWIASYLK